MKIKLIESVRVFKKLITKLNLWYKGWNKIIRKENTMTALRSNAESKQGVYHSNKGASKGGGGNPCPSR